MNKTEKQERKERLACLRKCILEMAVKNRGGLSRESILTSLAIDEKTLEQCLKKIKVKRNGNCVFFPEIEVSELKNK